ncbi:hypothetical protein YPD27_2931 [Yersinia pestis KIM D27]|nr:hypothetical protein YPD27_2931 [Yersinia pestis KIM D27]
MRSVRDNRSVKFSNIVSYSTWKQAALATQLGDYNTKCKRSLPSRRRTVGEERSQRYTGYLIPLADAHITLCPCFPFWLCLLIRSAWG